jgi:hypothetical protein
VKTRIPLPDFDSDDLATVTRLSRARARARQARRFSPPPPDTEALLDVHRDAYRATRSLRPETRDALRAAITARAQPLRNSA